jgi:hypothetical protein
MIMTTSSAPIRTVTAQHVNRLAPRVETELGNVVSTYAIAGPSDANELWLTITGFQLTTPEPSTVIMQARQSDNQEDGFPDAFAIQVVETSTESILVHIKRLDSGDGWGQNLRVDILIYDQVNNP